MQVDPSVPGFAVAVSKTVLIPASSKVPTIPGPDLSYEYQELGEALIEMKGLEEGDEWKIDAPVYNAACYVAAGLMANSIPAPRIFNHGPKSVVFNWPPKSAILYWSNEEDNLYLTVSANRISALISSPERIKQRIEYSVNELTNPSLVPSIGAAYSKKPVQRLITGAVPESPEQVG
jgi:hypothetical protein